MPKNNDKSQYINYPVSHFIYDDDIVIVTYEVAIGSLYDVLKICQKKLPFDFVEKIIPQMIKSIEFIHENEFIHTDIKPENFLLVGTSKFQNEILNFVKKYDLYSKFKLSKKNTINKKNIMDIVTEPVYKMLQDLSTEFEINDNFIDSDDEDEDDEEDDDEEKENVSIGSDKEDEEENDYASHKEVKPVFSTIANMEDIKRAFFSKEYETFNQLVKEYPFKYYKANYKYADDNTGRPAFVAKNLLRGFVQNLDDYRKYLMVGFRCISIQENRYSYPSYWIVNSNDDLKTIIGSIYDDFEFIPVVEEERIVRMYRNMQKNEDETDEALIGEVYLH